MNGKGSRYRPVRKEYYEHYENIFKYCQCDSPIFSVAVNEKWETYCKTCGKIIKEK